MKTLLLGIVGAILLCCRGTMGAIGVVYSDVNKPVQATSASGISPFNYINSSHALH